MSEERAPLSLWDGVSVVVGIVVGVSLFKVPAAVFGQISVGRHKAIRAAGSRRG